jgi:hypothetical protein
MSPVRVNRGEVGHAAEEAAARAARDAEASRLNPDRANRNRWCEWCGRHCGTHDRSVAYVAVVDRQTGTEAAMRLCPPCALAPDATAASRALSREWRRDAVVVAS